MLNHFGESAPSRLIVDSAHSLIEKKCIYASMVTYWFTIVEFRDWPG